MNLSEMQKEVHACAVQKGWWEGGPARANLFEKAALFHSEISEWVEDLRVGLEPKSMRKDRTGKPVGPAIEMADIIIRLLDVAEAFGVDLEAAIRIKMDYNWTRPHRHGGKVA